MTATSISVREVLRLLLEADSYPRQSNTDWRQADKMEVAALAQVDGAIESPSDPAESRRWLDALRNPNTGADEREDVYLAIRDYFAGQGQCPTQLTI